MRKRLIGVFAGTICMAAGAAFAQYPSRPIRFIIGFPPGGSADPATRILGSALSEQMRQPVVVDNRPGADGALSAELAMRAPADGHTLLFGFQYIQFARATGTEVLHVPYKGEGPRRRIC